MAKINNCKTFRKKLKIAIFNETNDIIFNDLQKYKLQKLMHLIKVQQSITNGVLT